MRFITILLCFFYAAAFAQSDTTFKPLQMGLTTKIYSKALNENRTVNIYLPPGYRQDDTTKYNVVYVLDGGYEEDFLHIAGLVQYASQPWVKRLRPSIVVGIENTRRQRDFTFAVQNLDFLNKVGYKKTDIPLYGGSAKYIAFLENELLPFVNGHFKTSGENTVIGESLAGLLTTEIFTRHTSLFNNYIIISPSLWWGGESLLKELEATNLKVTRPVKVYIGAPKKEEVPMMYQDAVQLHDIMQKKAGANLKVYFDYLPDETHATVIHQAVYDAFKMMAVK
ncbi:alpha/beta hydrolase-fold protein [Mucilaginibacter sp. RS28]|uniref:Alpha/beta hydrolase-fold protein n=1 Tax=Mucilaginibacter straminoryzae TaxID=2932774 RepID=A0A9X2BAH7_9SPHI|nr:alpha/beta hydrolase-fold protein [Mucilaginibacter straminoryzae]MCJ8211859.1 alpha/beta hydrolase-fold protein [Mucilaginibacter straminoryzae]